LQTLFAPNPLHPFESGGLALPPHQAVGHAPTPAPADALSRDLLESMAELGLLNVEDLASMALGAVVLPHHPVHKALRIPVTILRDRDGLAAAFRAQNFPSARSLSVKRH
jgi:hypothetical protein